MQGSQPNKTDPLRQAYFALNQSLNVGEVAETGLRLTIDLIEVGDAAVVRWETAAPEPTVLATSSSLPDSLLPALAGLRDRQEVWQAGPASAGGSEPDLAAWLKESDQHLTYVPMGGSGQGFGAGLLVWRQAELSEVRLVGLVELGAVLNTALANAIRHDRVFSQYLMLETVRKTWEQVWVSVSEQQRAIERMLARNQALHDIGLAINSSLDLKEILATIMRETVRLVGAGRGAIALWDDTRQVLTLMAEYNADGPVSEFEMAVDSELNQADLTTENDQNSFDPLAQAGLNLSEEITDQAAGLRRFLIRHWKLEASHAGATLISPLRRQRQTIGVIVLNDLTAGRVFAKDDLDIVTLIAGQASVAIENARLFEVVAQERNRNRAILDSITDGVFTTDLAGCLTSVNPSVERLSGYVATSLLGLSYIEAFGLTDRNRQPFAPEISPLAQATERGASTEPRIFSITRGGTDGDTALIALAAAPILDDHNTITGTVGVFRDVTHEQEVARLKDELISLVSHELRTPMASVLGFSELMLTRQLSEAKSRLYVETIYKEAQRLSNLINDFLDVQRMESGRQLYNFTETDLKLLMRQIANVFSRDRERLQLEIPSDVPFVRADPDRIVQTVTNLVSNGLKYSPDGGLVTVRARAIGSGMVEISVEDHGLGIPREAQSQLFSKFYRVDNTDRREIGGTGLGLAISREIIEAHGGKIWLESEPGQGSTFYFTLPAVEAEVPPVLSAPSQSTPARDEQLVLVVEDDESLANLITAHLDEDDYRVHWSASAEQASHFLSENVMLPAVIVLDIVLPGRLDGWDFLLQLKNDPTTAAIPVIISTVLDTTLTGTILGEAQLITKPVDNRRLLDTINRLTAARPQRNVLIIDDDASLRRLLKESLAAQDFVVATAAGGEQGLKLAFQNLPDLIILDLMMPRMDGFQVLARLRNDRRTLNVPVVIVSAKELSRQERQFLQAGTAHFLTKGDYTPQRIRQLIQQMLQKSAA